MAKNDTCAKCGRDIVHWDGISDDYMHLRSMLCYTCADHFSYPTTGPNTHTWTDWRKLFNMFSNRGMVDLANKLIEDWVNGKE